MDKRFDPAPLYDRYRLQIQIIDRICGGCPRNKELIKSWVEATTGHKDEISEKLTQENAELIVNEVAEKSWIGFMQDERGLFVQARQIKAMLKQSASILGITKQKLGTKNLLAEGTEVKGVEDPQHRDRIYLGVKEPSGTHEKAIHVTTAQGPRTALMRVDYVAEPRLTFEIWVLKTAAQEKRHIGEADLVQILQHSQENGMGASRSQGEGKFQVIEFQQIG